MPRLIAACLLLCLFNRCTNNKNQPNQQQLKDSLTYELNEIYEQGHFNGFGVAIVNENGTLYQGGAGYADKKNNKKYTDQTIQNIASISKTLIGISLLKAQEIGKLKLDDPISKYLSFPVSNPNFPGLPITIRQLATHTSGITDNEFYDTKDYYYKAGQDLDKVKMVFDETFIFNKPDSVIPLEQFLQNMLTEKGRWYKKNSYSNNKPGELYEYTNTGATLAAYIIERATGTDFSRFTKQYILDPLQMNASGWKFGEVDLSKYSRLYATPDTLLPYYYMITYPDGNFITSANDMGKYLSELIKGYAGHGTLLKKESYAELFRQQLTPAHFIERDTQNPYDDSYNTGIFMGSSFAGNIGHTGGDPGVSSMMFFDPKTKIGRYLVINTDIVDKAGNDEFYGIWDILGKYQDRLR